MNQGTPEDIIQQSIDSIEIEPELLTLERIEDTIESIKRLRKSKIDGLSSINTKLEQEVASLTNEVNILHKIGDYNYEIIRDLSQIKQYKISEIDKDENIFKVLSKKSIELDNLKVAIAKNLNDLGTAINSLKLSKSNLESEIESCKAKLTQQFENLELPDESLMNQDSNILKINLYRNLGVRIENFGEDRIVIYNKEKDLSSVLKVEEKYSDYFISNYIWERLEGYN